MEENAFLMGIAKVMAQANNTHTNISPLFLAKRSNSIPLRCYWFGYDLHVVLAQKPFQPFLGTKIKRINGKTPSDLLKELENWYGGSTNRLKFFSPLYFMSPELLEAINCGNTKNTIEIIYEDDNEEEFSVIVEASKSGKDEVGYWPSDWLNTSLMKKKNK
ncbi:MAG: hypothetical protein AAGH81_04495 [Bacteroidota bacterium]